jgi:hypothetical protein
MALSQLTSSDAGALARDKINAAIARIDAVDAALRDENRARADSVDSVTRVLNQRIDEESRGRVDVDENITLAIQNVARIVDGKAALNQLVEAQAEFAREIATAGLLSGSRPGGSPTAFAPRALGTLDNVGSFGPGDAVSTSLGQALKVQGAGLVAPRATVPVDPDLIYVLRARFWRLSDVLDPNNNAVDVGIQWLDAADGDAGRTVLHRESNLRQQDGPQTLTFRVPSEVDALPIIAAPKGAVSWRPYLQTYGADGATAVGLLGVSDATFAGVYAPDVWDLAARLGTIEGQIATGLPLSFPRLPEYLVADLPDPGQRSRKAWAIDGRAPSAAGVLEAANAGTGVEVVDNGQAWVISGTNQAVQA